MSEEIKRFSVNPCVDQRVILRRINRKIERAMEKLPAMVVPDWYAISRGVKRIAYKFPVVN